MPNGVSFRQQTLGSRPHSPIGDRWTQDVTAALRRWCWRWVSWLCSRQLAGGCMAAVRPKSASPHCRNLLLSAALCPRSTPRRHQFPSRRHRLRRHCQTHPPQTQCRCCPSWRRPRLRQDRLRWLQRKNALRGLPTALRYPLNSSTASQHPAPHHHLRLRKLRPWLALRQPYQQHPGSRPCQLCCRPMIRPACQRCRSAARRTQPTRSIGC